MSRAPEIFDVDLLSFETQVIAKSREVPVLVDFWASWCGPCQMLTPILHKLVEEYQGGVVLAKVNTDVEGDLAAQLQIRSLPTVMLFHQGRIVDQFMGVQPESAIKAMLEPYVSERSNEAIESAMGRYQSGDRTAAIAALQAAIEENPNDDEARLALAEILIADEGPERVSDLLHDLTAETKRSARYKTLDAKLYFADQAADIPKAENSTTELEQHPDDLGIRYRLAIALVQQGDYEQALEHLLEIIRRDRGFEDEIARRTMLRIFDLLGAGEQVSRYRGLLARALN
ncbi:MAG: thioredoxin [Gammaproteobacteria bacterium]|nr:thioredoxin [Gammaproteobacteria bacterium]